MKLGIGELLLIFVVALVVLGPDRLPACAKKLGKAITQLRTAAADATRELRESVVEPLEEAQRPIREAMEPLEKAEKEIRKSVQEAGDALRGVGKHEPDAQGGEENAASPESPAANDRMEESI